MRPLLCLLAWLILAPPPSGAQSSAAGAPTYSAASVVNSANNSGEALAPNTIVTIYGENLSYTTRSVALGDIRNGSLPTVLAGTGVWVMIDNIPAYVYYVSPTQVNFLVPSNLKPGKVWLQVVRDSRAGPQVGLWLNPVAPALYELDEQTVIATHPDGSLATADNPAKPGEMVVLYGTGMGRTEPEFPPGWIPHRAAKLAGDENMIILLDGIAVNPEQILYAGVTPGFAGLYQVNLRLPETVRDNPEIVILLDGQASPTGRRIPVRR